MVADFEKYSDIHGGVTAATIRASAEDPQRNAETVTALASELEGDDKAIAGQIEGDIESGTRSNPQQGAKVARSVAQKGYYAVGLLNLFATQVDAFDVKVDDLNQRLSVSISNRNDTNDKLPDDDQSTAGEIATAAKAALQGEYDKALEALDTQADEVAAKFKQGDTPENVAALVREGLIPLAQVGLWPNLKLSADDRRQALQNGVDNGTLPDFSTMPAEDVVAYIKEHPGISDGITALMAAPQLSPALQSLVKGQAAVDAKLLNDAIDAPPGTASLPDIEAATARLAAINESIADGGKMTAAQGDYIENYLNTVGADNLAKLPEVVRSSVPSGMPSYAADSVIKGYLSPVSDAILNYSNPDVHRADAGIDQAGYQGSTFSPADGRITMSEMPTAIQELTEMRLGYDHGPGDRLGVEPGEETTTVGRNRQPVTYETIGQEQFSDIANYDKYGGYADLLSSASDSVEGGADYSEALGHQAIQAKQDLNAIDEEASDTVIGHEKTNGGRYQQSNSIYGEVDEYKFDDGPMSDMLDVTARSEDGSSQLLLDKDDRQSLLALDWDDSDGATDLVAAGTDRQPGGGGDTVLQARAAESIMTDVSEDPEKWGARMGEPMENAVLDTGLRWVDTFGVAGDDEGGVDPDGKDILGREVGPTISLSDDSKENFMLFAAGTGDEQAVRFQGGLTHYGNQLIYDAQHPDPDAHLSGNAQSDQLKSALSWSGRAEGRMEAANIQAVMNDTTTEHDETVAKAIADNRETAANKAAATFVTSLATSGLSAIPGAGPFIGAGLGATTGPLIDSIFEENPVPDYESADDNKRVEMIADAKEDAEFLRDYRFAGLVSADHASSPEYADLYRPDGTLRPFDDLSGTEKNQLGNLGDNLYEDFNQKHPGQSPVARADTYDEAFTNTLQSAGVNLNEADPDESEEDRTEREEKEKAAEDERRRQLLYGDNETDWERWDESTPQQRQGRYRGPMTPRESPYDTTVGANE